MNYNSWTMKEYPKTESNEEIEALLEKCKQDEASWIQHEEKMDVLEKEIEQDYERIENSLNEIRKEMEKLKQDKKGKI
jgi:hypothetical protein